MSAEKQKWRKHKQLFPASRAVDLAASDRGSYYEQEKWIKELDVEESGNFKDTSSCNYRRRDDFAMV